MDNKRSENGAKASVSRDTVLRRVRRMLLDMGGHGSSTKERLRDAARAVAPAVKPSRVKAIWYGDPRVRIRADEHETITARWERWLEREERRLAEAHHRARTILLKRTGGDHAGACITGDQDTAAGASADFVRAGPAGRRGE